LLNPLFQLVSQLNSFLKSPNALRSSLLVYSLFFTWLRSHSQKKSLRFLHKLLFFSYCLIFKVLAAPSETAF